MASQISPGVIVKERDLTTGTVVNSAATNAAVVSTFQKGPVGEITQISSQRELVDTFGSPGDSNADDFFVASEFLNYGGRLGVVRAETGAVNAGAGAIIKNKVDYESRIEQTTPAWKWAARTPGIWGNDFDVVVSEASKGIATVSRETGVPIIFGVLTTDTMQQALERAGIKNNLGWSYALQALEMGSLIKAVN